NLLGTYATDRQHVCGVVCREQMVVCQNATPVPKYARFQAGLDLAALRRVVRSQNPRRWPPTTNGPAGKFCRTPYARDADIAAFTRVHIPRISQRSGLSAPACPNTAVAGNQKMAKKWTQECMLELEGQSLMILCHLNLS